MLFHQRGTSLLHSWLLRAPGIGWCLVLVWFVAGPWPRCLVDDPIFDTKVHAINAQSAREWKAHLPRPVEGPLRAGVGKVDLIQEIQAAGIDIHSLSLAGYGKRLHRTPTGVADRIYARALALDNGHARLVIVSADLLLISRGLADETLRALAERGVPLNRSQIYFTATHTHSSIGGYGGRLSESLSLGRRRPDVTAALASSLARAVEESLAGLTAAELGTASLQAGHGRYVRNRTAVGGRTNDFLDTLTLRRPASQEIIGSVVVFSAHATCRPSRDMAISADYPGVVSRRIEDELGGVCLFVAGAVGSMGPAELPGPRDQWQFLLGEPLAQQVVYLTRTITHYENTVKLASVAADMRIPEPCVKTGRAWRLSPILSGLFCTHEATFQAARLGDWILLGAPADFSGEMALDMRSIDPPGTVIVTSFSGDYAGYALPKTHDDLPTYEAQSASYQGPLGGEAFHHNLLVLKDLFSMSE